MNEHDDPRSLVAEATATLERLSPRSRRGPVGRLVARLADSLELAHSRPAIADALALLDKIEDRQHHDIDGMVSTIPWARDVVANVKRLRYLLERSTPTAGAADGRPIEELRSTGLLWLINRVVFHPRGYALALIHQDERVIGWDLLGDGTQPWSFAPADEDEPFRDAAEFFASITASRAR